MPSIALPVSLRGQLLSGTRTFSPSALFSANEPGVWFDPSDVANLSWRRNLLTYSEQFDNDAWFKDGVGVSANGATAPDGTNTADACNYPNPVTTNLIMRQDKAFGAGLTGTFSVWMRLQSGTGDIRLTTNDTFSWSTGISQKVSLTTTWTRFSLSGVLSTGPSVRVMITNLAANSARDTTCVSGVVEIWGAQLELGTSATDYQRISDVNTEVIERFPTATLYQDPAGTTPVTTPGNTVGLMLDKSKGLALGPELVLNGNFAGGTTADWTATRGATLSVVSETLRVSQGAVSDYALASQAVSLTVGAWYRLTLNYLGGTASNVQVGVGTNNTSADATFYTTSSSAQSITLNFLATAATMYVRASINVSTDNVYADFDNFSLKSLAGNHATQATLTARPTYSIEPVGGRRNRYTYSQDFSNAAWIKGVTLGSTSETAPDGTSTASVISNVSDFQALQRNLSTTGSNVVSIAIKKTSGATYFPGFSVSSIGVYRSVTLNTNTGVATPRDSEPVPAGEFGVVDNGTFWRVWIRQTDLTVLYVYPRVNTTGGASWVGGTGSQTVWGAQLEEGTVPTNYQRVTTQHDVTEAGVASVGYLYFDGVNDAMATSTITPGIDKAQVFAGVRKLDAAGPDVVVELSANSFSNDGSLALFAPYSGSLYEVFTRGTVTYAWQKQGTYAAPITNVVQASLDNSKTTTATQIVARVDGSTPSVATNQAGPTGAGNYLAYPLYLGGRAGTSLFFTGHLYSLITRFGPTLDAPTIASTEIWVAGKTGFYTPIITGVPTIGVS